MITVRAGTCTDVAGIARVHVNSWRTTYRGLMPADFLANLSYKQRENQWTRVLCGEASQEFVYVAADDTGQIVGFASGGPERSGHPLYKGELYCIYLLESCQRQGSGQQLFKAIVTNLVSKGFDLMLLWVLSANLGSGRFYEAIGGHATVT